MHVGAAMSAGPGSISSLHDTVSHVYTRAITEPLAITQADIRDSQLDHIEEVLGELAGRPPGRHADGIARRSAPTHR